MVVHTGWSLARLALAAGDAKGAAERLPGLIGELTRLGMAADAAYARIDLVEALVILGRYDDVDRECCTLVQFFAGAKIISGALTAVAYMQEASEKRALSVARVGQVRAYLKELAHTPNLLFRLDPLNGTKE
jgi:hypothetical protein